MTGLLICAAVVALSAGWHVSALWPPCRRVTRASLAAEALLGLALIAAALYLAWRAGGA